MMTTDPIRLERRAGQRFQVHLPLTIQVEGRTVPGFTQDVSARGVFLYTEVVLAEKTVVDLTFTMPSEITLAESMRVCCRGRVLRANAPQTGPRNGIAVQLDSYEYLPALEREPATEFAQVSTVDSARGGSGAMPR
jgi:PilZ domain